MWILLSGLQKKVKDKKISRLMNSMHSLSTYTCMKEKLLTYYKIRIAPLILFTTQVIFSACKIFFIILFYFFRYVLLNSLMES